MRGNQTNTHDNNVLKPHLNRGEDIFGFGLFVVLPDPLIQLAIGVLLGG